MKALFISLLLPLTLVVLDLSNILDVPESAIHLSIISCVVACAYDGYRSGREVKKYVDRRVDEVSELCLLALEEVRKIEVEVEERCTQKK
jgi:hypothetical protein